MKNKIPELLESKKSCISCNFCEEDHDDIMNAVYLCSKLCRKNFNLEKALTTYCAKYKPWTCDGYCDSYKKFICTHIGAPGCIIE